ncbi:MAG: macrolide ABC transporter ATP-binding protein [Candidatus Blackburnbacteria bacterium RIFCSPLOWO2_02_FULL_44_9]|uniref:Macrolide ABC transporter ATP-binding protein n=1 Tax=Candidatus Blackburnbacteria bacterium RIFCSPHIGHO2_02_FULL_44_20 TaxID=1797516 RepID=A0A1G1V9R9_9BACT|nr:MAG: macrolide ABC transporter ATP-binding protein [Candidatus Blackburnbacteria bacterium RIFCSPHIGHO2_12_FULL_44_25]OGY12208.1 MAG: macrolide ABC transporter ATP-binding protein [Candidatus Blackburnbacteria bacterium RIFCSPHIGHO2_02_FULL_44_20]OGY15248.1 MAG: macrolide ABC transporter ATP-binding protein [Candidatus Blackburnbacteria bacterium RIFCSPLOWO2_01_FULL_44_43]OGY16720.1 MAG: macrolide ABC transporter ATP-binding protein [Candidatus Blackburnbacteria bacterium RIFCSPLOWO2_02_FULL_
MVRLKNVSKVYDTGGVAFYALRNVNLSIKKGEFVAIVGPSGSGKSTLMNILGLLDTPTSGMYELDSRETGKMSDDHLAEYRNLKIGFVFQNFNLLSRTTALDNVSLPLVYAGVSGGDRKARAQASLEEVGLGDKLNSRPNQLSGGQQQRVAIARAIVSNPEVILADEPTGNLDSKSGKVVISIFRKLHKEGKTVILITHDRNVARNAKRIYTVRDGKLS